jgi:hypothetical protein
LKKEEKAFGTLDERARLWPGTIRTELQASPNGNYFAVWEEIKQRISNYVFAHAVRGQSRQDGATKFVTAGLNFHR